MEYTLTHTHTHIYRSTVRCVSCLSISFSRTWRDCDFLSRFAYTSQTMSEFDGIHIMYEKSLYTTFLALALTIYSCTTLSLSLPFFPHFEIFPVNTKLYAVCVLLQNIKFLYSNSLGLVLSHSEYSYSSSFCLESFSLVLSPALALARLTFDRENVVRSSLWQSYVQYYVL